MLMHRVTQAGEGTVNSVDFGHCTLLMEAAKHGRQETLQMLLELGADVAMQDASGCVALHHAAGAGATEACVVLCGAAPQLINAQDAKGRTPLHWASLNDHDRTVAALIARGASTKIADSRGKLPLQWTAGLR